jgi:16S rRNA (cytosine967-C5)-methyltransferase
VAVAAVPPHLRAGVQALLFQVLRQLGRAQALRSQLAKRAPPPLADALLCTALALAWRDDEAPYEPHTLVNQAVEAAVIAVINHPAALLDALRAVLADKVASPMRQQRATRQLL